MGNKFIFCFLDNKLSVVIIEHIDYCLHTIMIFVIIGNLKRYYLSNEYNTYLVTSKKVILKGDET